MANRIVLIVPYFGQFNSYYEFWLRSCQANDDLVDWLIFTDDKKILKKFNSEGRGNLKVYSFTLAEVKRLAEEKFGTAVALEHAYKLCDLRPMYGLIFEDYLHEYEFWGECDNDLIFGRMSHFLTSKILASFDKILTRGHLTIYRNTPEVNNFFRQSERYDKIPSWRNVLSSPKGFSFDEWPGVSRLWHDLAKDKQYDGMVFDDILWTKKHFLSCQKQRFGIDQGKSHFIFEYDRGQLWRIYWDEQRQAVDREPTMYVHFQKRNLKIETADKDHYLVVPNAIIPYQDPSREFVLHHGRKRYFYGQFYTEKWKIWKKRLKLWIRTHGY